jgi:UTP--glucose-1-phosphate uridylyltransferase
MKKKKKGRFYMVKKAIIPAAGYGTRGLPITKVIPKEMFPIGTKPAIEYVVEEAIQSGIETILIIVSKTKSLIIDYFDYSLELEAYLEKNNKTHLLEKVKMLDIKIYYTRQPYARGLGDAIRLGKEFIGDDPFAVLLPDDIIVGEKGRGLGELVKVYQNTKSSVVGLTKVEPHLLKNYGVIKGTEMKTDLFEVKDIIEKPKSNPPSDLAVIGRYIFTPQIISCLEDLPPGVGGEIQLTDAIQKLLQYEKCYGQIIGGERFDIGTESGYVHLIKTLFDT